MKIALIGNPNVGKSTVFNALTGMHQKTGNWPGKTVGVATGTFRACFCEHEIVDLPGTYSLNPHSPEEKEAADYIISGAYDLAIVLCDASCLERNLILALQVVHAAPKTLLCVNMMDEAKRRGTNVNLPMLEKRVGTAVVGITARSKRSIRKLTEKLCYIEAAEPKQRETPLTTNQAILLSELITKACVRTRSDLMTRDEKIDRIITGRWTAIPIMICLLGLVFYLTLHVSNIPSDLLSGLLLGIGEKLHAVFLGWGAAPWLCSLIFDGIYKTTVWVVSVMLPPMLIFFPLFTYLEDLGYLPRMAFNLDRCFHFAHGCGKQALTMCQGLGCNAVGVTGCRIIDSPRERLIAMLTNVFIPCNGRMPTMLTLITVFLAGSAIGAAGIFLLLLISGALITVLVSRALSGTVLRGESSFFTLELPPYRMPQLGKILLRSLLDRCVFVLGRAVTAAVPAGIVIWLLANIQVNEISLMQYISSLIDPAARLIGMDGVILLAFVLSLPANEILIPIMLMGYQQLGTLTAAGGLGEIGALFTKNGWTPVTAICVLLFSLMHWPCFTTILTIYRESKSIRWTLVGTFLPAAVGAILCAAVALLWG